jgi:serine/threonine protein kinase/Flp pilus assembly protein TadD
VNPHRSSPLAGRPAGSEVDSAALSILDSYLCGIEGGEPADPQRLLADHPALADQLRAYLQVMHLAGRLAEGSGARPGLRPAGSSANGQTGPPAEPSGRRCEEPPHPMSSRMSTINFGPSAPLQIQLREIVDDPERSVPPRSAAMPEQNVPGRYQLEGEIARGGMGAIIKGRDLDLGRELAIKVLLEPHQGNPELVRRFVEEAQIGGQLQHPGVVPVYELGTFPDRRPYFTMKLVKGRTLAALLRERTSPAQDLSRFLGIFEQACQTIAYAHARGVVHRDLKPSNVMVGSFGEVQVMDWGLAKVLSQGGIAEEAIAQAVHDAVITTVRSGPAGTEEESQAGSILGTPSYMAPEQARGEVERIDERADVFGLGAILCEILTGRPPYIGSIREEVRVRAARGDLADALARLDASRVDVELIDLAGSCLAAEPDRRPRAAGEVVRRLTAYLDGVQERVRAAEWARVEAQARAEEEEKLRLVADELAREARAGAEGERKRRRLTAALAGSVLVTAGVIGGGWAYLVRHWAARSAATTRVVTAALADAERLRGQAQSAALGDLTRWTEARGAARRARDLLAQGEPDDALRARVTAVLADVERERDAAVARAAELGRDRALLGRLETIRGDRSEHWDPKRSDADYAAAFRAFGIDPDELDPGEAGRRLARRSEPVELASYLDDWAETRRKARAEKDDPTWRRLLASAQAADRHPWREALRDQIGGTDLAVLRRLADDEKELAAQSPTSLRLLAMGLIGRGDRQRAERVLRCAWRLDPGDFWVNYDLAEVHKIKDHYTKPEDAIRFGSAAVAIRPRSFTAHNSLGIALKDAKKLDEAAAEFRAALQLKPDHAYARNNLGNILAEQGKFEEATVEFREALRLQPDFASPHDGLGNALCDLGKPAEAVAEYREALRLKPDFALTYSNLSYAMRVQGKFDEAIAAARAALRLRADLPEAQYSLALALRSQGQLTEAVAEMRKARDLARNAPDLEPRVSRALAETERQASLAARLPAILAGQIKPGDVAETLDIAQICYRKGLQGASAWFWAKAFRTAPKLADDMQSHRRYDAACAAALAGCGQGKDRPPLDDACRARWRQQALEWLEADLGAWTKTLESSPPRSRPLIARTLLHWKTDPDLAGLRDPATLAKFPEDQQKACRALWDQVEALLAKAGQAPGS